METSSIGDSTVPIYEFEWDDGSRRTTEELPKIPDGIETLALLGREDPDCDVSLLGFTS